MYLVDVKHRNYLIEVMGTKGKFMKGNNKAT